MTKSDGSTKRVNEKKQRNELKKIENATNSSALNITVTRLLDNIRLYTIREVVYFVVKIVQNEEKAQKCDGF